ncbi:MAG TPA: hypothetical protein VE869_02715 [Gemmatimonas sp.]|nr:hypothetical protein [Gemmatimonas sp.]
MPPTRSAAASPPRSGAAHDHGTVAAVDFGISNTDVVVRDRRGVRRWTEPFRRDPDEESVRQTLGNGDVELASLARLVVTGGRHRVLPDNLGNVRLQKVSEVDAIGRGGQAILGLDGAERDERLLVVSAGSGTAMILAESASFAHVSGTGVGGGTMLGFGKLLLGTTDPVEIGALADAGDRNAVDLSLADVITGPIGALPADATAVNFGRAGRRGFAGQPRREDLAAALVNLVAQTIALIAVNAAKAHGCTRVVMVGHMLDLAYVRRIVGLVGSYYDTRFELPEHPGTATALGALALSGDGGA